jgi:hypothetical protein
MKSPMTRTALIALVMIAAVSLTGCVKDKKVLTILPDGSGKVDFTMGFNAKLIEETLGGMMPQGGEGGGMVEDSDPTNVDVNDLKDNFAGFVAFTEPTIKDGSDGWKYVSFTGYFENINDVQIFDKGKDEATDEDSDEMGGDEDPAPAEERESKAKFVFKKTETGYTLAVVTTLQEKDEEMGGDEESNPEMEKMVFGMMAAMLKDMEISMGFVMPGAVSSAEGMTVDGRNATYKVTGADFKSAADLKKLVEKKEFKITCGASQMSAENIGAFKTEMAEATVKWQAMLKKAEAEKDNDEAGDEDGDEDD